MTVGEGARPVPGLGLPVSDPAVSIRRACRDDVEAIVALLADDDLGSTRESTRGPIPRSYDDAFEAIDRDAAHELVVAQVGETVVGTLQLSVIPYLTYEGGSRAQVEAVRVARDRRGERIGEQLVRWAIDRARERGCHMVQLTTDRRRGDVVRFYEKLGFRSTHEGMKLWL